MAKFEAVYYEGEWGERLPSWDVVCWNAPQANGSRMGSVVEKFGPAGEAEARELAWVLQHEYDAEFAAEFA